MTIECQVCRKGIKIPSIYDHDQFDGQLRCHCGRLYRIKLREGHLKRYGLMSIIKRGEYENKGKMSLLGEVY